MGVTAVRDRRSPARRCRAQVRRACRLAGSAGVACAQGDRGSIVGATSDQVATSGRWAGRRKVLSPVGPGWNGHAVMSMALRTSSWKPSTTRLSWPITLPSLRAASGSRSDPARRARRSGSRRSSRTDVEHGTDVTDVAALQGLRCPAARLPTASDLAGHRSDSRSRAASATERNGRQTRSPMRATARSAQAGTPTERYRGTTPSVGRSAPHRRASSNQRPARRQVVEVEQVVVGDRRAACGLGQLGRQVATWSARTPEPPAGRRSAGSAGLTTVISQSGHGRRTNPGCQRRTRAP